MGLAFVSHLPVLVTHNGSEQHHSHFPFSDCCRALFLSGGCSINILELVRSGYSLRYKSLYLGRVILEF